MIKLVDVVNFNSDASALGSKNWLNVLDGGKEAEMYKFLQLYVENKRPVTFGWVGNTAIEMFQTNPECIALINDHPDIFEVVLRPLSHDLALLWGKSVFNANVETGIKVTRKLFRNVSPFFLPPEFALKNVQLGLLKDMDVEGVFTHLDRMKADHKETVPREPYLMHGLFDTRIKAIPFQPGLTQAYLNDIQQYDYVNLETNLAHLQSGTYFSWRDGESPFLIPETLKREEHFLRYTNPNVSFVKLSEGVSDYHFRQPDDGEYPYYPISTLVPWFGDFRFYWFITELKDMERHFTSMSPLKKVLFLSLANSDILSSIEKNRVHISLVQGNPRTETEYTIHRKSKNINGGEFLEMMDWTDEKVDSFLNNSGKPHHTKLWLRYKFLTDNGFI